jgi:hypothetical protein
MSAISGTLKLIRKSPFAAVLAGLLLAAALTVSVSPAFDLMGIHKRSRDESTALIPPPQSPELLSFGYAETMADSLWVRVIQDLDACATLARETGSIASAAAPPAPLDPTERWRVPARCENGWSWQMFDAITKLAPEFRSAYRYGSISLSILADDRLGAEALLKRGLERFPDDLDLLMTAGYHALVEMNKPTEAADYLVRAGKLGGPPWVFSLAARLHEREGREGLAYSILKAAESQLDPEDQSEAAKRVRQRLKDLEEQRRQSTN